MNYKKDNHSSKNQAIEANVPNLTYGSLTIALVLVSTFAIKIPIPFTQGYIHPGDSMIFIAAILFGWRFGALAGGIGSAMADLLGGYAHWALPTLFIKSIMGALVGWLGHDLPKLKNSRQVSPLLTIGAITIWVVFSFSIRTLLKQALSPEINSLLSQSLETGQAELISLVHKTDFWLNIGTFAIPIGGIVLAYYLKVKSNNLFSTAQLLGMIVAGLWMVIGYYAAGGFIYGSFIVPILSIPANIVQFIGGIALAYLILVSIKKAGIERIFNLPK